MNARPAACTAPSAVPATTATAKNCALVCTRYAAATTTHHCTSVTMTTNFGPRTAVRWKEEERRHGEDAEERRGDEEGAGEIATLGQGERGGQGHRRAQVADGEAVAAQPALTFRRRQVGEIRVVVDDGALEADRADDGEEPTPHHITRPHRGHDRGRGDREIGEREEETLAQSAVVGDGAERR